MGRLSSLNANGGRATIQQTATPKRTRFEWDAPRALLTTLKNLYDNYNDYHHLDKIRSTKRQNKGCLLEKLPMNLFTLVIHYLDVEEAQFSLSHLGDNMIERINVAVSRNSEITFSRKPIKRLETYMTPSIRPRVCYAVVKPSLPVFCGPVMEVNCFNFAQNLQELWLDVVVKEKFGSVGYILNMNVPTLVKLHISMWRYQRSEMHS
mmetsp:Transcript_48920/g.56227  ORF Transcript_48920/g.56227 Transcript_48920/m.56227 type:complete len:207 (-) Transcript_48920:768-1388(-)